MTKRADHTNMAADVVLDGKSFSCVFSIFKAWILVFLVVSGCDGATHWIVTENGRIEQQANSYFNLQKPFDLVAFIHQEQRLHQMNILQQDLKQEQQILEQVNEQEQADVSESFFKTDPACKKLKRRLHEMDLNFNQVISFSSKNINLNDHIDVNMKISKDIKLKTPECPDSLPSPLLAFDHLVGIAERHRIPSTPEPGLLSMMQHVTDVDVWGHRVASALQKNSSSWVLQNMAALFWRVKGYTTEAINCLRQALYNSPRKHRDMSLFSLGIILHRANYSMGSIILLHASLETTSHLPLHHLVLGVIYASIGHFQMSEICFQYIVEVQPDLVPPKDMLQAVTCEKRYMWTIEEHQRTLKESVNKVKVDNHRQQLLQKLQLFYQQNTDFPFEQFANQLHWLRKKAVKGGFHPMETDQNRSPVVQTNSNDRNKQTQEVPCKNGETVDSCTRNLKNEEKDVKNAKENNGKPTKKKESSKNDAEILTSNVENSSHSSNGPSSSSSSGPSNSPSSSPSNGPSSGPSNGLSNGPTSSHSSSPSSHPSKGSSKKEELTKPHSHKNIKIPVEKQSRTKKEQKPSEKDQSKTHNKVAQDKKPAKGNSGPRFRKIKACVSPEKGFQSTFDPSDCKESDNKDALMTNDKFSVVTNFDSKGIDVRKHVNFNEDISGIPKPPRCLDKIKTGHQSFDHLEGIKALSKMNLPPEYGIKQTLLMHAMNPGMTVEEVGTRIHRALKKNSTSWVLLNLASIYWRIMGDTNEAVRCLRLALVNSPSKVKDVSLINLASILFKAGFFEDAVTVSKVVIEISPNTMIAHFTLANSLAALGRITEATQHFLMVLQIEPGFMPAVERLKIIQCILWRQQKELEKEAEELKLLLRNT